jgi:hypothetical protein
MKRFVGLTPESAIAELASARKIMAAQSAKNAEKRKAHTHVQPRPNKKKAKLAQGSSTQSSNAVPIAQPMCVISEPQGMRPVSESLPGEPSRVPAADPAAAKMPIAEGLQAIMNGQIDVADPDQATMTGGEVAQARRDDELDIFGDLMDITEL